MVDLEIQIVNVLANILAIADNNINLGHCYKNLRHGKLIRIAIVFRQKFFTLSCGLYGK